MHWYLFDKAINIVKFDDMGKYVAVASGSGELLILQTTTGEIQYEGYDAKPTSAIGFASNFDGKRGHFIYSTQGGSFRLVEKKTFGSDHVKKMINRQNRIVDISWHENLLAWVSLQAINVLDMKRNTKLLYFDKVDTSINLALCPPLVLWFDEQTLLVSWGDNLMAFCFSVSSQGDGSYEASVIAKRQFPFYIASMTHTSSDEVGLVGFDPPEMDDEAGPKIAFASVSISDKFQLLSYQQLPGLPFKNDLPRDITVVSSYRINNNEGDDALIFVFGSHSCIAVQYVTLLQKIEWFTQRGRLTRALQLALERKNVTIDTYFMLVMAYTDKLLSKGLLHQAIQCSNWLLFRCKGLRLLCSYSLLKAQGPRGVDAAFSLSGCEFAELPRSLMVMFLECWMLHQPLQFALKIVQWAGALGSSSTDSQKESNAVGENLDATRLIVALKRCLRARENALRKHRESKESHLSATLEISIVPPELPSFERFTSETDSFFAGDGEIFVDCMGKSLRLSDLLRFCPTTGCIKSGMDHDISQRNLRRGNQSTLLVETEHICEERIGILARAMAELNYATGNPVASLKTYITLLKKYHQRGLSPLKDTVDCLDWSESSEWAFGEKKVDYADIQTSEEFAQTDVKRTFEIIAQSLKPKQFFTADYLPSLAATDPVALSRSIRESVDVNDLIALFTTLLPSDLVTRIHQSNSWQPFITSLKDDSQGALQYQLLQLLAVVHHICIDTDTSLTSFNGNAVFVETKEELMTAHERLRPWHDLLFMLYLYFRPELAVGFLRRSTLIDIDLCLELCRQTLEESVEQNTIKMRKHIPQCQVELYQRKGEENQAISVLWNDVKSVPQILDLIEHASRATTQEREEMHQTYSDPSRNFKKRSSAVRWEVKKRHKQYMRTLEEVVKDKFDPEMMNALVKEMSRKQIRYLIPLLTETLRNKRNLPISTVKDVIGECKEWESILSLAVHWMQQQEVIRSLRERHRKSRVGYRFVPEQVTEDAKQKLATFAGLQTSKLILFACGHAYTEEELETRKYEMERSRSNSGSTSDGIRRSFLEPERSRSASDAPSMISNRHSRTESSASVESWTGPFGCQPELEEDTQNGIESRPRRNLELDHICPKCEERSYENPSDSD